MREFVPKTAKTIPEEAECKFRGEIFDVYQWSQEMFDGTHKTFEMLSRPDTVKVLALVTPEEAAKIREFHGINGDGLDNVVKFTTPAELGVVVTKQRQPRTGWFYDYPGGRVDVEDKNELEAAKRELKEETGLEFREWKLVEVHQPFAKLDWLVYTFVASGLLGIGEQSLDAGEEISVLPIKFETVRELAKDKNTDRNYLMPDYLRELGSLDELQRLPALTAYD